VAWALNITLGGPATGLGGGNRSCKWAGPPGASARLEPGHLKRGLYLTGIGTLLLLFALVLGGFFMPSR
jgi:hypothetical protein